jgi:hypothetical protein
MNSSSYDSVVADINAELILAGITTVTFSRQANQTIDSVLYTNTLRYTGHYLESQSQAMFKTLFTTLEKYGNWKVLKAPTEVVSLPSDPAGDHRNAFYGHYVHQSDVDAAVVVEDALNATLNTATTDALNRFKNIGTSNGYELNSFSGSYSLSSLDMSNNRALTVSINISLHKPT